MKKLFAIFLIFVFSSCAKAEECLPNEYDADISICIGTREYTATYEKRNAFDRLVFVSPSSLSGLDLTLSSGSLTVKMEDMTFRGDALSGFFDFLPIEAEGEKSVGSRKYTIYNIRGVQ